MIGRNKIPPSWEVAKLGEVCTYSKGKKPVSLSTEKNSKNNIPYINIKAFEKGIFAEYTNGEKCNLCNDADLLMVWDGARCGLIGKAKKGAVGSTLMKILPKENIHKEYLYHFISSKFWTLNTKPKGVGIPHIEPTLLWNFELVLPPLPEQQAIVAKIEELLSDLENGKQQLQTAQQQLKFYRQSLLKWAFEKSAESVPVKLVDVCDFITKGTTPSKGKLTSNTGEIPFLKVYNLTFDGTLNFSKDSTYVSNETHNVLLKRSKVYPNDVLMNIVGPPLGKVSIVPNTFPEWNINQAMVRFRCQERLLNKYLMYFLLSENTIRKYARKAKATAGQFNLTLEICRDIEIPLPNILEQLKIVEELESKLTVCDKIEETISHSLQQAETLRQSILKKAFEGKLVTQNPNDEPASKLLEKIKAESAKAR